MQISVSRDITVAPPEPSPDVMQVAAMFGLGADTTQTLSIIPPTTLELHPGQLIFITGPSGSGKSTLLHLIQEQAFQNAEEKQVQALSFEQIEAPSELPLVDALHAPTLEDTLRILSIAGLNDAPVMLRTPSQLSDGQRYRLRLAQLMAKVEAGENNDAFHIILADEFGATLDRRTAGNVARQIRKWITKQTQACFVCATTHDDLLEDLEPNTLIHVPLGASISVWTH